MAAGSALGLSARAIPTYTANAKVFVGPRTIDRQDAAGAIQELTFSRELVASYAEILKSRTLAEKVIAKTRSTDDPADLAGRITTKVIPETRLIQLSVNDTSPELAEVYANELVNTFVDDKDKQFSGGSGVTASLFEKALRPTAPATPKPFQNTAVGALFGLLLGTGLSFVIENLDTAIRSKEDAERAITPIPVIAAVPQSSEVKSRHVFMQSEPSSIEAEAIRILRTNVQFFSVDSPVRKVLVTSPDGGDGKTTVALNLAASIAAVGSSVLLVETDLRKPVLHDYFGVHEPGPGLSNVLAGQVDLDRAIKETVIKNLSVLPAGTIPPNPSELLGSERMVHLLTEMSATAEVIVLDTPPALPVTDAAVLAPHVDGVIVVLRAGKTAKNRAVDVIKALQLHDVRILGAVLNGVDWDAEGHYHYRYAHYRQTRKKGKGWQPPGGADFVPDAVRPAPQPSAVSVMRKGYLLEKSEAAGPSTAAAATVPPGAPAGESPVASAAQVAQRVVPQAGSNPAGADDEFEQTYSEEEASAGTENASPNDEVDSELSEAFFNQAIDVDEAWDRVDGSDEAAEDGLDSDGDASQSPYASVAADVKTKKRPRKQTPKARQPRKKRGSSN